MGNRVTRNTFDPRLATRSAIYRFTPEIRAITTISVETERIIPSSIRKERILYERSVSSATQTGSRSNTRRFICTHPSLYSTINEELRFAWIAQVLPYRDLGSGHPSRHVRGSVFRGGK